MHVSRGRASSLQSYHLEHVNNARNDTVIPGVPPPLSPILGICIDDVTRKSGDTATPSPREHLQTTGASEGAAESTLEVSVGPS